MTSPRLCRQRGAALLLAMLTVTLVATLAATALWRQWRSIEVEAAERNRAQLAWILHGALDWARLILREDARAGQVDHLSEPWALPLNESRLSSFLAHDRGVDSELIDAFLSGLITDAQSRLNVLNLVEGGKVSEPALRSFAKLFRLLNLPISELEMLVGNLRLLTQREQSPADAPLLPQKIPQLRWLGLSPASLQVLAPYVTLLPARTAVNLNTASAEVICASLPGLDLAQARQLAQRRQQAHFRSIADILRESGQGADAFDTSLIGFSSQYFLVQGRLRIDHLLTEERSLVQRNGLETVVLWREREQRPVSTPSSSNPGSPAP